MLRPIAEIVFHINQHEAESWRDKRRLALFGRIAAFCEARGVAHCVEVRNPALTRPVSCASDGRLHIVEDGRVRGDGWLNAATAYLQGFWHLDPNGILAESSAKDACFNPRSVAKEPANLFFRDLQQRFVKPRLSRYGQPRAQDLGVPKDSIALFLQGKTPQKSGQCALSMQEMILAVCKGAGHRKVVVKPHPLSPIECAYAIASAAEAGAGFEVFTGNIHDLLEVCAVTVSANSAAAMEGFLHRKPAILFGRADYESITTKVESSELFSEALATALSVNWRFAKMLYWYFSQYTVELDAPDFEARLCAIFERAGLRFDSSEGLDASTA